MTWKTCLLLTIPVACIFGVTAFGQECGQRDVVAAGRDCKRPCCPGGTCRKRNRECVCDGRCGLSCLRKRCPLLSAPLNGNVVMNPKGATIGAEATYSCDEGYEISGQTNRVCQANKTWSAIQPTCIVSRLEALCNIETIANGNVTLHDDGQSNREDASHAVWRHFTCEEGYTIVGEQRSQCLDGEWTIEKPSCVEESCPAVANNGDYQHIYYQGIRSPPDLIIFPAHTTLEVDCAEGRVPEGPRISVCRKGMWDPPRLLCLPVAQPQCTYERDESAAGRNCERACRPDGTCRKQDRECICDGRCGPVCLRKTCPALAQPGNGSILINPSGRFVGSEATYSCDDGFQVVGNGARICQANKTWSGTDPTCQKSTAPLKATPIPVAGGQCARNDQEIQNQKRRCMRQCESNSDCLRGRTCVCDDICGLSCIPIDRTHHCEDLPSDQSVLVRITPNNRTFGSTAQYECRSGHDELGGSHERKCIGSGQWSGVPLTCISRVRCGQPPEVANSVHNGTKSYYVNGDIVIYRCDYGYYRSGNRPLSRCSGDKWSEPRFQCSPKSCGDPGHILNGRRIGASFVFLASVEYRCNPGYEMRGLSRRNCRANQEWSGSLPTCHLI